MAVASLWMLGVSSVVFSGLALIEVGLLVRHLGEHAVPLLSLFEVLSQSQHPTHIRVLYVFTLVILIPVSLMVGLQGAFGLVAVLSRRREQKLLLKLVDGLDGNEGEDKKDL